jgi:D-3-phosphoglycerate dehydrogenase
MRGPKPKYPIELATEEEQELWMANRLPMVHQSTMYEEGDIMPDRVVLLGYLLHPAAFERLQEQALVISGAGPQEDFLRLLAEADGVIVGGSQRLGAAEMDLVVGERLRVIGRHGVGLDNVDVTAASQRGIPVVYTPYGPTESTAEHALLLMIAVARRLPHFDRAVRGGNFGVRGQSQYIGRELKNKALGVVGMGRIGQRVAEMCRNGLEMSIYAYDPFCDPADVAECGAVYVDDLMELARAVDILSVHVPLTDATHHLINRDVIRATKPGAIFINTSRGPVADEAALIEALQDGHLYGVGLDVYDPEPPPADNPLFELDNVVLTPHIGSFTDEGRRLMGDCRRRRAAGIAR